MDNVMELESRDKIQRTNEALPMVGSQLDCHEIKQLENHDRQSLTNDKSNNECMASKTCDNKIATMAQDFELSAIKISSGVVFKNNKENELDVCPNLESCGPVEITKENCCVSGCEKCCVTKNDCIQTCFKHSNGATWINNNVPSNSSEKSSTFEEAETTSVLSSIDITAFSNIDHTNNSSSEGVVPSYIHHEAATSSQLSLGETSHDIENADDLGMNTQNYVSNHNKFVSNTNNSADFTVLRSDSIVVISNKNALPETESIVPSSCSLAQLKTYGSEESLNEEPSMLTQHFIEGNHRVQGFEEDSDSDSSSSSSSTSILISDSSDSDTSENEYENYTSLARKPAKIKGELELEDLPPIQDLKISMPEEACTPVGKVFQIVDRLVVVQSLKDVPAYDLDTVLFVQGGKPLGRIFDVFGPVIEPYYCIRFNSNDHIKEKNITLDQTIYSAPKSKHTRYVFLAQLLKLRGSDASWEDDIEPPKIYLDYSDDEQEQKARKRRSSNRRTRVVVSDPDEPARKRHSAYERRMNERNSQLSAVRNSQSYCRNRAQSCNNILWAPTMPPPGASISNIAFETSISTPPPMLQNACHNVFGGPPLFNTRVPPPSIEIPTPIHQGIANIHNFRNNSLNLVRNPPPNFSPPGCSTHFPQVMSPCAPRPSPRPCFQPYPFPPGPPRVPGPVNNIPGHCPPSISKSESPWASPSPPFPHPITFSGHRPSFSQCGNPWMNSPPPPPPPLRGNNNFLPTSPFWIQRPQNDPSCSRQPPFSASPCHSFPPPRAFLPTQPCPQTNTPLPFNNFTSIRFNPNVPPPSPNSFNP